MITLTKSNLTTSNWLPLESGTLTVDDPTITRIRITDADGQCYVDASIHVMQTLAFAVRGMAGRHQVRALNARGEMVAQCTLVLRPHTSLRCNAGPYTRLAERLAQLIEVYHETLYPRIDGRIYRMFIIWTRDHVYTLKAMKYYLEDVKSGLEYWLETQNDNGMFWDCIHPNQEYPGRTCFGEALGEGWFRYDDGGKWIVRRVPILADTEFVITEGVWYAWKASGDDAWLAAQLPRLEKALRYNNSDPVRWSTPFGLVKRSMCMDGWDWANPKYTHGPDVRCLYPGDPQFLFHGDNSGLYASYWRMAEMYAHLGNTQRADELRTEGEAFRQRANDTLFFDNTYGHMIPETLDPAEVYAEYGDERERMSFSLGYTINRKLPTHAMAVKILDEYRRRGEAQRAESFAEWWTMDPPYTPAQWIQPDSLPGEYMNGAICPLVAGELAKAAFDHGREAYGVDILARLWTLSERDGGELFNMYRRQPYPQEEPRYQFQFVDLSAFANRGLREGAHPSVTAWLDEGENDMRELPNGRQQFGRIEFDLLDPAHNDGRAVMLLSSQKPETPRIATIPLAGKRAQSLWFLQATGSPAARNSVLGWYDVEYTDGTVERIWLRYGEEIACWWGPADRQVNAATTRVAWRGANGQTSHVGLFMYGWSNSHPEKPIIAIHAEVLPDHDAGGLLLAGMSLSDGPVEFETRIRSNGLPDCWTQAAVYYAVAEGLAGIEDTGESFRHVQISPRWSASQADEADITLHYPASDGYCSYRYRHDAHANRLTLEITGSFTDALVHCLLPAGKRAYRVTIDSVEQSFTQVAVEASSYADFVLDGFPLGAICIDYEAAEA